MRRVEHISLYSTKTCNLNCRYCYATHLESSADDEIKKSIQSLDIFKKMWDLSGDSLKSIGLWGGEPGRILPYITGVLSDELLEKYLPNVMDISLSTNLSTTEIAQNVIDFKRKILSLSDKFPLVQEAKKRFHIQVSIDGPLFIQEYNRTGSSFLRVLQNIEKLQKEEIEVSVKGTLSIDNIQYLLYSSAFESFVSFILYLKKEYNINFFYNYACPLPQDISISVLSLLHLFEENVYKAGIIHSSYINNIFSNIINPRSDISSTLPCSAGKPYSAFMDVKGNHYACHSFFGNSDEGRESTRPLLDENPSYVVKETAMTEEEKWRNIYKYGVMDKAFNFTANLNMALVDVAIKAGLISSDYKKGTVDNFYLIYPSRENCITNNLWDTGEAVIQPVINLILKSFYFSDFINKERGKYDQR